jgi:TPR repeat protein
VPEPSAPPNRLSAGAIGIALAATVLVTGCPTYRVPSQELNEVPVEAVIAQAEKWDREAIHTLCYRYATGSTGVARDYERAHYWCGRGAIVRIDASLLILGDLHYYGLGRARDFEKAFDAYWQAAQQNRREAKFRLYRMYSLGQGIRADPTTARNWLEQSAEQGFGPAIEELNRLREASDRR